MLEWEYDGAITDTFSQPHTNTRPQRPLHCQSGQKSFSGLQIRRFFCPTVRCAFAIDVRLLYVFFSLHAPLTSALPLPPRSVHPNSRFILFFKVLNIGGTNVYYGAFFNRYPHVVFLATCSQRTSVACLATSTCVESRPALSLVAHDERFIRSSCYRTVPRVGLPSYQLCPQPRTPACANASAVR